MKTSQLLTIAGILAGSVAATASAAGAAITPIGPNQIFHGVVNGVEADAVIKVICPGPSTPGQTGHPVSGQTIAVVQGPSTSQSNSGYTGSAGTSIIAGFGSASSTNALVFSAYNSPLAIPTSILLPCSGKGAVQFTPHPDSDTARAESLPVTFVNIAV